MHISDDCLYLVQVTPNQSTVRATVFSLLEWYPNSARDLPWRRTRDPYSVYVSEIMLQQTQVKTVVPFWERWMQVLPTVSSLARAKPDRIHKLWEGLGYYTRVRNMQKTARVILTKYGGQFPRNFGQILDLPGIGRYTAGAICSIAFNEPRPILDGNVIRVLCRIFGVEGNPRDKTINATLWELSERLVKEASATQFRTESTSAQPSPKGRGGSQVLSLNQPARTSNQIANPKGFPLCSHLNQSLMELGALICTSRQPKCESCPLGKLCIARREGRIELLPEFPARPRTTRRRFVAFVARRNGEFLVQQRPAGVVNAHLWEFPNMEVENGDGDPRKAAIRMFGASPVQLERLCTVQHSITRYRIRLDVVGLGEMAARDFRGVKGRWLSRRKLHRLAFASAHKKILSYL